MTDPKLTMEVPAQIKEFAEKGIQQAEKAMMHLSMPPTNQWRWSRTRQPRFPRRRYHSPSRI